MKKPVIVIMFLWVLAAAILSFSGCSKGEGVGSETETGTVNYRGNSTGNLKNDGLAAIQGNWIYYSGNDGIYKMKKDGSGIKKICDDKAEYINIKGDWIYYRKSYYNNNSLYKVKTNGKNRTSLLNGVTNTGKWSILFNLSIIDERIYFHTMDEDISWRLRLLLFGESSCSKFNMPNITTIMIDDDIIAGEADRGADIYIIYMSGSPILSLRKNVFNNIHGYWKLIDIYDDWLYFTINSSLYKITKDGNTVVKIVEDDYFRYANISDGWMYFANSDDGDTIYRMNMDSLEEMKIVNDAAENINVTGDWIFYECAEDNQLYRIRTDGSDRVPLG